MFKSDFKCPGCASGLSFEDAEYLRELAEQLDSAFRIKKASRGCVGSSVMSDEPEGTICIEMSDTLAREISGRLRQIVE